MKRIGIVGSSGFTGKECLRLLAAHPEVEVATVLSARPSVSDPTAYRGALREPSCMPFDPQAVDGLDAVLLCAPHETAAQLAPTLLERVPVVVDLSAAHRLRNPAAYETHYRFVHPHPELLETAVFGLTEWAREPLSNATLVANPGCYVTSVLLPLLALRAAECIAPASDMIADCKSGVTGAGKSATAVTHFASVHEDFRAYGVGTHRHEPEIREQLGTQRLYFTAHLLPVLRGILSTIHVEPRTGLGADEFRAVLLERYAAEPFVHVHTDDEGLPCLADVQGSNRCHIGVANHGPRVVVVSCLDNLVKGAAGQAVQNLNVVFGLPETFGLDAGASPLAGWR
ncbi:MAG: N-acetyl-gamma-glutamyl-phosphate reductase [Planctomycetes bacterium]|nr:N-acetyl-gamma-glutamyl-phosphate reductase [Planctomycetota bacterium]